MARCTMPGVVIGAGGQLVLGFRQAEEDDAPHAERLDLGAFLDQLVDGKLVVARHGADFAANAFARANKQGKDELPRMEMCFPDQRRATIRWRADGGGDESGTACQDCTAPAQGRASAVANVAPALVRAASALVPTSVYRPTPGRRKVETYLDPARRYACATGTIGF